MHLFVSGTRKIWFIVLQCHVYVVASCFNCGLYWWTRKREWYHLHAFKSFVFFSILDIKVIKADLHSRCCQLLAATRIPLCLFFVVVDFAWLVSKLLLIIILGLALWPLERTTIAVILFTILCYGVSNWMFNGFNCTCILGHN